MDSKRLLDYYLARGGPEAQRWNLSPENLAAELSCRTLVREWVKPKRGFTACNVGIGVGEWDDYLGLWLEGRGKLTSVDSDKEVCDVFRYRQRRERHPNPARVLCRDLLAEHPTIGTFDLVTLIGSTGSEAGSFRAAVAAGLRLLKPGGNLFTLGFHRQCRPRDFRAAVRRSGGRIVKAYASRRPGSAHFIFMARRTPALSPRTGGSDEDCIPGRPRAG